MRLYLLAMLVGLAVADVNFQNGNFKASWSVQGDDVIFDTVTKTKGWSGIGFSKDGSMEDSDIVIAGVKDDGSTYILNRYGLAPVGEHYCPAPNLKPHWKLLEAKQDGEFLKMKFSRPLDAGHPQSYKLERGKSHYMIFAWNPEDFTNDCDSYHGPRFRGSQKVNLFQ